MAGHDDYNVVQFCDSTNWIRMGGAGDTRIGTLTASKWCAVNVGGTAIDCTQDAPAASAGSDTQVIFNDGGSTLAGAAQFLWDKTNNRLGIGSASAPTQTLDVTGTASVNKINLKLVSGAAAPIGASVAGGSASHVQFNNGSGLAGDSNLIWDDTNKRLGIGTTSPGVKLHVLAGTSIASSIVNTQAPLIIEGGAANGNGNVNLQFLADSTKVSAILFSDQTANSGIIGYTHGTDDMYFYTNATEKMRILASGNVGIGMANPSYKLDVETSGIAWAGRFHNTGGSGGSVGQSGGVYGVTDVGGGTSIGVLGSATNGGYGAWFGAGSNYANLPWNGAGWSTASDINLKTSVNEISGPEALAKLSEIRGVTFKWKKYPESGEHMGIIAQEVQKVFPQIVAVDRITGNLNVEYNGLIAPLISAVNELKAENDNLRAELNGANDNYSKEIRELREDISALKAAIH